ncbi:MAG: YqgE/AlgH family protein [Spirochaetia bacterium]|nr:YqgE/AlgH family protein [Spirochaetia bacterium]
MIKKNNFLSGNFLVSNSTIQDPNFLQTVVFLIEHDEHGAFGLVVNRLKDLTLRDALQGLASNAGDIYLFEGGPVRPDALFILHGNQNAESPGTEIISGVYLGSSKELIEELINNEYPYHIYHGYAGWGPGQLESEMEAKTWVTMPATKEIIFHEKPDIVWREALHHKGGIYGYFAKNVKNPFLN